MKNDRETIRRVKRLALRIESGNRASAINFRSRQRFAGRAEPMGLNNRGRLRDYHFVLSALRERSTYRYKETAPRRQFLMVLDVRFPTKRLLEAAALVGGVVLAMDDTILYLGAFGSERPYPSTAFAGIDNWPSLVQRLDRVPKLRVASDAKAGRLRQACRMDEACHVVLVTHYLEPKWLSGLGLQHGGTLFAVEPSSWGAVGAEDAVLALGPAAAVQLRLEERYAELSEACRRQRIDMQMLAAQESLLTNMEQSLQ